jgi:hypothetical protein
MKCSEKILKKLSKICGGVGGSLVPTEPCELDSKTQNLKFEAAEQSIYGLLCLIPCSLEGRCVI